MDGNPSLGTNAKTKKPLSAVTQLTSANFDEIVMDKSKDVVVEFYASWYRPVHRVRWWCGGLSCQWLYDWIGWMNGISA